MTGAASAVAQSNVALFGVLDVSMTRLSSATSSNTGMSNGELSSSRLGFRGVEDLGGGLKAGFWLEGSVGVDNGGANYRFDRRSTVSLSGPFGELRLGRDKQASYLNIEAFDPFGDIGVGGNGLNNMLGNASGAEGTAEGSHPKRANNIVSYISPDFGGVHGQLQYSFGERPTNQGNSDRGKAITGRLGYKAGPLDVALGYGEISGGTETQKETYKAINLGAAYDLGMFKPMVLLATERGAGRRVDAYTLGVLAPVAAVGELRIAFTQFRTKHMTEADTTKLAIGYVHRLSKRTALYGMAARVSNQDNAARGFATSSSALASPTISAGDSATGYSIGIRHQF